MKVQREQNIYTGTGNCLKINQNLKCWLTVSITVVSTIEGFSSSAYVYEPMNVLGSSGSKKLAASNSIGLAKPSNLKSFCTTSNPALSTLENCTVAHEMPT